METNNTGIISANNIIFFDIETYGRDSDTAILKFCGFCDMDDNYTIYRHNELEEIKRMIKKHNVLVGFNCKDFDIKVLERYIGKEVFAYPKLIIDLYEISAPVQASKIKKNIFGGNKGRLKGMGIELKNYKLKTIVDYLKLDEEGKGEINYDIFKKDEWSEEELKEIHYYLKQDLKITKKLFLWYETQFEPLKRILPLYMQKRFVHLTTSYASLAYRIMCAKLGVPVAWDDVKDKKSGFTGAHHIEPRWEFVKGNVCVIDIQSAYPNSLIMANLYSPVSQGGWNGDGYFKLNRNYDNKEQGKKEAIIKELLVTRLEAKKNGDKIKSTAFKLVNNTIFGGTGNPSFKYLFDVITCDDCTGIVRTIIKKLSMILELNGFQVLYGATDSIFVLIPNESNKNELMFVVSEFIKEVKSHFPFPSDTFSIELQEELKFIWFVEKKDNNYLYVDKNNKLDNAGVLKVTMADVVLNVFKKYISPKIIRELDINFTEEELRNEILKELSNNIELAAKEFKVYDISEYKVESSQQYQISKRYSNGKGGTFYLIANKKGIGVGKGVCYCSMQEFKENNLTVNDIDIESMIKDFEPFIINHNKQWLKGDEDEKTN